jgi:hypothetical protein
MTTYTTTVPTLHHECEAASFTDGRHCRKCLLRPKCYRGGWDAERVKKDIEKMCEIVKEKTQ